MKVIIYFYIFLKEREKRYKLQLENVQKIFFLTLKNILPSLQLEKVIEMVCLTLTTRLKIFSLLNNQCRRELMLWNPLLGETHKLPSHCIDPGAYLGCGGGNYCNKTEDPGPCL